LAGTLIICSGQLGATTINARSVAYADVAAAVALARDGDTVIVPAGTADWSATLTVTKGIKIQGATTLADTSGAGGEKNHPTDRTIINDRVRGNKVLVIPRLLETVRQW
jgi:hypothetical protein